MVSRKLKNGPASTVSIRRPTTAPWKLCARSSGLSCVERRGIGAAGAVGVAEELDVAAERQRRDLPERAAPVAARPEHRPEADREHLRADAAPARDDVVAVLVHEDHDPEHDHEGQHRRHEAPDQGNAGDCVHLSRYFPAKALTQTPLMRRARGIERR